MMPTDFPRMPSSVFVISAHILSNTLKCITVYPKNSQKWKQVRSALKDSWLERDIRFIHGTDSDFGPSFLGVRFQHCFLNRCNPVEPHSPPLADLYFAPGCGIYHSFLPLYTLLSVGRLCGISLGVCNSQTVHSAFVVKSSGTVSYIDREFEN